MYRSMIFKPSNDEHIVPKTTTTSTVINYETIQLSTTLTKAHKLEMNLVHNNCTLTLL